jgi:uncharacterized protein (DUF2236 family)
MTRPPLSLDPARVWIAEQIRSRVIGDEPDAKAAEVMLTPGPRWFAEGSVIREVHADAAMLIGGLRALLLQSLHPLAMAGVAAHSDYRADPWGRLQRTADFLAATTYGPVPMAERAIGAVQRVHSRVAGVASDGRSYSANDPHLLRWVHIAEMDSFLAAHQRYGSRHLPPADVDAYLRDCAVVAEKLGVVDPPRTHRELRRQLRAYRPELRGCREARESARFLLFEPPLPLAARGPYTLLAAAAVSLLPAWARWPLRLPLLPVSEAVLVKPAGAAVTHLIRWSLQPGADSSPS